MRIRYSPAAREDLRELRRYLVGEFGAPVADRSVRQVVRDISTLKRHPGLLRPLADKIKRPTDYQYFLCVICFALCLDCRLSLKWLLNFWLHVLHGQITCEFQLTKIYVNLLSNFAVRIAQCLWA